MEAILRRIIEREGGFVNDPDDPGGATKYGVTQGTLSAWRRRSVSVDDVRRLGKTEAMEIFAQKYFYSPGLDQLPAALHEPMLDFSVHSGPARAIKILQRAAGCQADGVIGPGTLRVVKSHDPDELACKLCCRRRDFLFRLAARRRQSRKYFRTKRGRKGGWLRRVEEFLPPEDRWSLAEFDKRTGGW